MRKRTRAILWSAGALAVIAAGAAAVIFVVTRSGGGADRLVGSWEGQGDERTRIQGMIGEGKVDFPLSLRTTSSATFHKDGTLDWSLRAEAEGFQFSFTVPDPNKPGDVARWEVVRSGRDGLVVRLVGPDGPEYAVSFRGDDEFAMTPVDPAKGTGTIVFRRVKPGT
jgi:hypothetical protein